MKILIINQPPNNRGDESAHRALVRSLLAKSEDVQIRVLYVDKPENWDIRQYAINDDRVRYVFLHSFLKASKISVVALRKKWREKLWNIHPATRQIKAQYDWADLVVCAPGGICMGGFQDWNHLYMLKWAKHCKKPLAYFGRSFGPFPTETKLNQQFKSLSYEMLNYFSFLSIRDRVTEKLAQEIGISYISTVDTTFLDNPTEQIPYELRMMLLDKEYMVFVPNYLLWHPKYAGRFEEDKLVELYVRMIKEVWTYNKNLSIVMLPQTFGNGNKIDDIHLFRQIAEKLNDSRVIVVPDCYSSDVQQSIIRDAKFVIGARYHSIVFAINQNVPFIALSYEHKIEGLLATLGKEDCMIDFTETMSTVSSQEKCIADIRRILPLIKSDADARNKAKQIAKEGLEKLVKQYNIC